MTTPNITRLLMAFDPVGRFNAAKDARSVRSAREQQLAQGDRRLDQQASQFDRRMNLSERQFEGMEAHRNATRALNRERLRMAAGKAARNEQATATARSAAIDILVNRGLAQSPEEAAMLVDAGLSDDLFKNALGGGQEFGLNPVFGTDAEGKPVILQLSKSGTAQQTQIPEGVELSTGVDRIDLGTQIGLLDKRTGEMIGTVPKDLVGQEAAKARGRAQGEAQAAAPGAIARSERTLSQIDELLAHEGLDEITGRLDQFRPNVTMSGSGRDALARLEQLQGTAFLEAFEMLKGGGQITEIEGLKAERAMARMQRSQDTTEFRRALRDFRDAVETGRQKLLQEGGEQPAEGHQRAISAARDAISRGADRNAVIQRLRDAGINPGNL